MENYIVVLFKNKKKKKILNKFITYERAKKYYNSLINKSNEIIFEVNYENGEYVEYEIGLLGKETDNHLPVYVKDNFGRNIKVALEDDTHSILEISKYKKQEYIFDVKLGKKIDLDKFMKTYLKNDTLKVISLLNNKVVVQKDDMINLFSLKNEKESHRFVECLSNYFFKIRRTDCLFIKDDSTPQRKYLLNLLESNGFDKKILYRKFTTHPRPK